MGKEGALSLRRLNRLCNRSLITKVISTLSQPIFCILSKFRETFSGDARSSPLAVKPAAAESRLGSRARSPQWKVFYKYLWGKKPRLDGIGRKRHRTRALTTADEEAGVHFRTEHEHKLMDCISTGYISLSLSIYLFLCAFPVCVCVCNSSII